MKNKIFINGPVNVIRLEGEIDGIKKVLYVFMDFHEDVTTQTRCDDIKSKDVNTYLVENFDKINEGNKIYDFFYETRPTWILREKGPYKENYIEELDHLFNKSFIINKDKNVVGKSNNFPNVRLHYADIRDYLIQNYELTLNLDHEIDNIMNRGYFDYQDSMLITDSLNIILANIMNVYNIIYNSSSGKKKVKPSIPKSYETLEKYTPLDYINKIKNFVDKIRNRYNHKDVKTKINHIMDNELNRIFIKYLDNIDDYFTFLDKNKNTYNNPRKLSNKRNYGTHYGPLQFNQLQTLTKLSLLNYKHLHTETHLFAFITDMFFLRRFLEKDYVTNGISYTGAAHSNNYIYCLVKYFNFKITHYSYLKGNSIKKITNIIKRSDNSRDLDQYFWPPYFQQCSDMTDFPKLFE